jgi:hypothetical protein
VKAYGSFPAVVEGKTVGPVNSAVTSLFKQLTTTINSSMVETTDNYAYQCYFQHLRNLTEVFMFEIEKVIFENERIESDKSHESNESDH